MLKEPEKISLSKLTGIIGDLINEVFSDQVFWVTAETAEVKIYPDRNYCFVTLIEKEGKDTKARMEGVIWPRYYSRIHDFENASGIRFDKNIKVLIKVNIDFSQVYGLKLQIQDIDPSFTLGEMEKNRRLTLEKLLQKNPGIIRYVDGNYETLNQHLPKPLVFQKIALITAPDSEGRVDFLHELESNPYRYSFHLDEYLTRIQGDGAEQLMTDCLQSILSADKAYDAVVIVRGGGSVLDFGPFDTYDLGLAVAGFPLPVITGIGHERNVSIVDLLSHQSVKTPTKAASYLIDHNRNFEERVENLVNYIFSSTDQAVKEAKNKLSQVQNQVFFSASLYLSGINNALDKITIAMKHMDPENVLAKGYALVIKNNQIITDPEQIIPGDEVDIRLKKATFRSLIKNRKYKK